MIGKAVNVKNLLGYHVKQHLFPAGNIPEKENDAIEISNATHTHKQKLPLYSGWAK